MSPYPTPRPYSAAVKALRAVVVASHAVVGHVERAVAFVIIVGGVIVLARLRARYTAGCADRAEVRAVRIGGIGTVAGFASGVSGAGWGPIAVTLLTRSGVDPRHTVGSALVGRIAVAVAARAIYGVSTAATDGPDLFYESLGQRRLCSDVCKGLPLRRALATVDGWITGLRPSGPPSANAGPLQPTVRPRLPLERLRAVHARRRRAGRHLLSHLAVLEAEAIHIFREAAAVFERPALLFSGGKDSPLLSRLAEKAFRPGRFPFPVLHVDKVHNFPEVLDFRDRRVAELGEELIVASVQASIDRGWVGEEPGPDGPSSGACTTVDAGRASRCASARSATGPSSTSGSTSPSSGGRCPRSTSPVGCTGAVVSSARTVDEVIAEVAAARATERGATRAHDALSEAGLDDRKREAYV